MTGVATITGGTGATISLAATSLETATITTSGGTASGSAGKAGGTVDLVTTGTGTLTISTGADIVTTGSAGNGSNNNGGAGGAVTLNGDALKSEGQAEVESLKERLHNFEEGNTPLGFVIG